MSFLDMLASQARGDLRELPRKLASRLSGSARLENCISVEDVRRLARRRLPGTVFDFVDGAAGDEIAAERNQRDLRAITIEQRVLRDVSEVETATEVLGTPISSPIIGAPTGLTGVVNGAGEVGIAQALGEAGTIYAASAMASYNVEEISSAAKGPLWFQLYMWRDRALVTDVIRAAHELGYRALVLTVDVPRSAKRERDHRNGFRIPLRLSGRSMIGGIGHPRWSAQFLRTQRISLGNVERFARPGITGTSLSEYIDSQFDPSVTWDDVDWLREVWDGPLVLKGILHPDDAKEAIGRGVNGIVVSNHGGRQLDQARSSISALAPVVDVVEDSAEVYFDGGIRRGSDILKAITMGARACLVGRPFVYGLGALGARGVKHTYEILRSELAMSMAFAGVVSVRDLQGRSASDRPRADEGATKDRAHPRQVQHQEELS